MQIAFGDDATLEDAFSVWADGLLDEEFGWGVSHEQFLGVLETHKCKGRTWRGHLPAVPRADHSAVPALFA
jgi:hypothetical protein